MIRKKSSCAHVYDAHLVYDDYDLRLVHLDLICISCKKHLRIDVTHVCVSKIMKEVYNKEV